MPAKKEALSWVDDVLRVTEILRRRAEEAQDAFRKSLDERGFSESIGYAERVVLYSEQWEIVRSIDHHLRDSELSLKSRADLILEDIANLQRSTFQKRTATSTNAFHNAVDNCRLDAHLQMFRSWGGELLTIKAIIEKSQESTPVKVPAKKAA